MLNLNTKWNMKIFHRHVFYLTSYLTLVWCIYWWIVVTHICYIWQMSIWKLKMMKWTFLSIFLPLFFVAFYHLHDIFFHWSFTFFLCILCVIYWAFFFGWCFACHLFVLCVLNEALDFKLELVVVLSFLGYISCFFIYIFFLFALMFEGCESG